MNTTFEIKVTFQRVFQETQRMRLELKEQEIIWMGRSPSKPEGFMIPTHLKVC